MDTITFTTDEYTWFLSERTKSNLLDTIYIDRGKYRLEKEAITFYDRTNTRPSESAALRTVRKLFKGRKNKMQLGERVKWEGNPGDSILIWRIHHRVK